VFAGARYCSNCGGAASTGISPEVATSARACPRCGGARRLLGQRVSETLIEQCHHCGGVWMAGMDFDSLIRNRDEQAAVIAEAGPHIDLEHPQAWQTPTKVRYIPCPDCQQLMNRKNFAHISGVIIDVCKMHGVWFDCDELGRIIGFVTKGGLDTARKVELEAMQRQRQQASAGTLGPSSLDETQATLLEELLRVLRDWMR